MAPDAAAHAAFSLSRGRVAAPRVPSRTPRPAPGITGRPTRTKRGGAPPLETRSRHALERIRDPAWSPPYFARPFAVSFTVSRGGLSTRPPPSSSILGHPRASFSARGRPTAYSDPPELGCRLAVESREPEVKVVDVGLVEVAAPPSSGDEPFPMAAERAPNFHGRRARRVVSHPKVNRQRGPPGVKGSLRRAIELSLCGLGSVA